MQDVIIIGAGVVGCALARELSRYKANVLVLERASDVSCGATKANSGIIHAGFDAVTGTLKARYNVLGNAMFDKLSAELDFPFRRNGSLVLCFSKADESKLYDLLERGKANGVSGLSVISGDEVRQKEPSVSPNVTSALFAQTGGIVSPYEMAIALFENARTNGVHFVFNSEVNGVVKTDGGFTVTTLGGAVYESKTVVNCAGVYSDVINNYVSNNKLQIVARKGDYELFDKNCGMTVGSTLFQLPTERGKGVLVTPTVHGNLLIGPTATDVMGRDDVSTTSTELAEVFDKASISVTSLPRRSVITQFSGLRAHLTHGDFVVGESDVSGFFNAAGIESPGLTSAPAIAVDLASQLAQKLRLEPNADFVATRKAIPCFATMSNAERQKLIAENSLYGKIVCRCENVTEGEIVEAIRRGATDLDGVKRRTRAGMGRCQAGFCTARTMEILARELGVSLEQITKSGSASQIVKGRTK